MTSTRLLVSLCLFLGIQTLAIPQVLPPEQVLSDIEESMGNGFAGLRIEVFQTVEDKVYWRVNAPPLVLGDEYVLVPFACIEIKNQVQSNYNLWGVVGQVIGAEPFKKAWTLAYISDKPAAYWDTRKIQNSLSAAYPGPITWDDRGTGLIRARTGNGFFVVTISKGTLQVFFTNHEQVYKGHW